MVVGITGASGHFGNVLCREFIAQGHKVKALYHSDTSAFRNLDIAKFQGNVLDKNSLIEFVKGCNVIVNSAAIISIHGDPNGIVFRTNTEGPRNILELAIEFNVKKLIHVSSTHAVIEHPLNKPFDETRAYKTAKSFAYDYSKASGEQIMLDAFRSGNIEGIIVRPSSIVGPFDFKPSELGKALMDFKERKIPILPPGGHNFVDVRDISAAVINAVEKGKNGEIYLLSGKYLSLKELASLVTKVTGVKTPKMVMPFWFMQFILPFVKLYGKITGAAPVFTKEAIYALKNGHPNMDNTKAKEELNLTCRPMEETLRDFYAWQKEKNES